MIDRRKFLQGIGVAGSAGALGYVPVLLAAEAPPETTRIRIIRSPAICFAPLYVAEELLRAEGFTDVQYVKGDGGLSDEKMIASGAADMMGGFAGRHILAMDGGDPVVVLAGMHVGCYDVDKGYTKNLEHAVQTIKELPYDKWHDYDPADTLRYYALRMHEAGMIKTSPQKILAQGTDWRFVNQLRKELKA